MLQSGIFSNKYFHGMFSLVLITLMTITAKADQSSNDEIFARYARHGAKVWARNQAALIAGEGQSCVSCHTSLPYALVEPLLSESNQLYSDLLRNIDNRIRTWENNTPWYADAKLEKMAMHAGAPKDALKKVLDAPDSRGSEAVLNVFIRAMHDAYMRKTAQPETKMAFEHLWAEQIKTGDDAGKWKWIKVNLIPWEAADSDVWGASLACVASSLFPELAPKKDLELLYDALREASQNDEISLHAKSAILWCNAESDADILSKEMTKKLTTELLALQHGNGAWALRDIGPWTGWEGSRADCCQKREVRTDIYATGFITLVLSRLNDQTLVQENKSLSKTVEWINSQLLEPYPENRRINRHNSNDIPEFREHLYTNGGMMWAYLAKWTLDNQRAPWDAK